MEDNASMDSVEGAGDKGGGVEDQGGGSKGAQNRQDDVQTEDVENDGFIPVKTGRGKSNKTERSKENKDKSNEHVVYIRYEMDGENIAKESPHVLEKAFNELTGPIK